MRLPVGSHRRLVPSGFDRGARGATLCVLTAAAAALGVLPAGAAPQDDRRAEVDRLYEEAEHATESYNKADERADLLHDQVDEAQDGIARHQDRVNTMRDALGSLAGAQYRSGGLDPSLALMFSDDPDEYLDKAAALDRISARQAGELKELQGAMRDLAQEREEATRKLAELDRSRKAVARHKRTVERKLSKARELLNAMPDGDRAAYDRASRSGRTPDLTGAVPSSGRAGAAVAAARSAVGRPYVWGPTGPPASTVRASRSGRTRRPVSDCRAPRRPRRTPGGRCRSPRRSRVTSSPTGTTPAMSGCTWATAR